MRFLTLVLLSALPLAAQMPPLTVSWAETPARFAGQRVLVELDDHTRLEGDWESVTADTFTFRVEKTSRRARVGPGMQTLPRTAIHSLKVGHRRIRGRVIGTLFVGLGVTGLARAVNRSPDSLQGPWGIAALAGGVGGYFLGRSFDKATRDVVLLP